MEERKIVLQLLADGKITVEEAEKLLDVILPKPKRPTDFTAKPLGLSFDPEAFEVQMRKAAHHAQEYGKAGAEFMERHVKRGAEHAKKYAGEIKKKGSEFYTDFKTAVEEAEKRAAHEHHGECCKEEKPEAETPETPDSED